MTKTLFSLEKKHNSAVIPSADHAVSPAYGIDAASSIERFVGLLVMLHDDTTTYCACDPARGGGITPITSSPGFKPFTPSPTT